MRKVRSGQDLSKPFRVSADYIDWAHESAAADGHGPAIRLLEFPRTSNSQRTFLLINDPVLVAEVADVAELYVGGPDRDLRAHRVFARAVAWLRYRGLTVRQMLARD